MTNSTRTGTWVLIATILGSSMAFIDGTVVNVALPSIQADLNASLTDLQWIVQAYLLFLASLILVGGALGDRYGRNRIFGLGIIIFALASAWSGFAPTASQLIWARAVQGIGGALLTPGSLAILSANFHDLKARGKAIGTWSAASAITTAIGPILGGWLLDSASWRWVFFINIPLAVIVLVVLYTKVPESRDEQGPDALDWLGAFLATFGLAVVTYGLTESNNLGLSSPIVIFTVSVGLILLLLFVIHESRTQHPMMPMFLFKSRNFLGANLLTFFLYGALGWVTFYLPLDLIQIQGYTATQFGFAFLPFVLLLATLSSWAGGLVGRVGAKVPLTVGPMLVAIGFYWLSLAGLETSYLQDILPGILLLGLGMAVAVAPLTTTVMSSAEDRFSGVASGINNAVARSASLLTIAIVGIFALLSFSNALEAQLSTIQLPQSAIAYMQRETSKLAEAQAPDDLGQAQQALINQFVDESFISSFQFTMRVIAGFAVLSAVIAFIFIDGKKLSVPG